jgi:hypothetical protein
MRAASGFYSADAVGWKGTLANQKLGVFLGIDVVGHDC